MKDITVFSQPCILFRDP